MIKLLKFLSKFRKRKVDEFIGFSGALLSKKDDRDYLVGNSLSDVEVPEEIDLRNFVPEVKNQSSLNSCVPHSICSAIEMQLFMKDPARYIPLSELFNYYYGRIESKLFPQDTGVFVRDAIKSLKRDGVSIELLCPYKLDKLNEKPSNVAYSIAHIYSALVRSYYKVYIPIQVKQSLSIGLPVLNTVPFYSYWFQRNFGVIRNPISKDVFRGYHNLVIVGYDKKRWICLNSWGKDWGDKGFCYLPLDYEMPEKWVIEVD